MNQSVSNQFYSFRPMQEGDLPEVIEIERMSYVFPWSKRIFTDCLRIGYCCWIIQSGSRIGAYGIMTVNVGESHILNMCVRPGLRKSGLGSALLQHLLSVAGKHHATTICLEVRPSNRKALQLYERSGFIVAGTRVNYYPAPSGREDAMVLRKDLAL